MLELRKLSGKIQCFIASVVMSACLPLQASESVMLVFDASGSMWEKSGNSTRLEVAKGAVDQLLVELPQDVTVGMTVYGHRRKGDCTDIQTYPESLARSDLRNKVQGITARGKTALGASIEKAAKNLAQSDTQSRVIALTDGLETCGYDLCGLANTLKSTGVGLVVDVVAFELGAEKDVSSLRCLADITGGSFYSAEGFEGLSNAFESITAKATFTQSDVALESTEIEHAARAELGDHLPVTVNAELTDGKMYMLTLVPAGSPAKTMTEGVSKMLQIGSTSGDGKNSFKLTLRSAVLQPGEHEIRILDMLENRIALASGITLFQPGQLSDTDVVEVVQKKSETADAAGSLIVESKDKVASNRFLELDVTVAGDLSTVSGIYEIQLVQAGTPDGIFPDGSTRTNMVINSESKSMTMRAPEAQGSYELRIMKRGQQVPATRLPVTVY